MMIPQYVVQNVLNTMSVYDYSTRERAQRFIEKVEQVASMNNIPIAEATLVVVAVHYAISRPGLFNHGYTNSD